MRRIFLTLCFAAFTTAAVFGQEPATEAKGPEITFTQTKHDFGKVVYRGKPHTFEFEFTNTGDAPLVILRTELSCTCLSSDFPKKPIAPGQSGKITVTYTAKKDMGAFSNTVTVVTNATAKRHTLFVEGEVVKK